MSMFPHTVTVYNVLVEPDPTTLEDRESRNITILRGVLLDESKGTNVRESGLEGADAANLYIPFSAAAVDGVTGQEKRFVGPNEYWAMLDKSGAWTLSVDRNTFFIKGEAVEPEQSLEYINMKYDSVYTVSKVDAKDFGSASMQHWEVGGV